MVGFIELMTVALFLTSSALHLPATQWKDAAWRIPHTKHGQRCDSILSGNRYEFYVLVVDHTDSVIFLYDAISIAKYIATLVVVNL